MQTFTHAKITSITWYPHNDPNLLLIKTNTNRKNSYFGFIILFSILLVLTCQTLLIAEYLHLWVEIIREWVPGNGHSTPYTPTASATRRQRRGHSDSERRSQCQLGRGYERSNTVSYGATLIMLSLTMEVNFMWHDWEKMRTISSWFLKVNRQNPTVIEN